MIERELEFSPNDETDGSAPGPAGSGRSGEAAARPQEAASESFWNSGDGIHALDDPTPFGQENALQKLGKPPFEKTARGRFRLLGYLATVYEHVSQDVRRAQTSKASVQRDEA